MPFKASAPGSLMLLGEYAVLYGRHALVCAVNKRINVTLTPRNDSQILIHSELLGEYATDLKMLRIEKPFQFVLGALNHYRTKMKTGCDISIASDFSDKVGFGSSAAVTVATLAALITWLQIPSSSLDLVKQARNVVRHIQGTGSGADVAASVFGGIINYIAQPLNVEKFASIHPIVALYAGFKTPTADAIKKVQAHFSTHPNLFRILINGIGQCASEAAALIRSEDWAGVGKVFDAQQGMMHALGVNIPILHAMIEDIKRQPNILGAKISGSGLGDCIIGLGRVNDDYDYAPDQIARRIPVEMTLQGVDCEKV